MVINTVFLSISCSTCVVLLKEKGDLIVEGPLVQEVLRFASLVHVATGARGVYSGDQVSFERVSFGSVVF